MNSKRTVFASIVLLVALVSSAAGAGSRLVDQHESGSRESLRSTLLYADLVLRGTIMGVQGERVPAQEIVPGDPRVDATLPITDLRVRVDEVIRGNNLEGTIDVVVVGGYPHVSVGLTGVSYDAEVGDHVILALKYWKFVKGGQYILVSDEERFTEDSDGDWKNRATGEAIELDWIRKAASITSLDSLAARAELVCEATISGMRSYRKKGALVESVTVEVVSLLKGGDVGRSLAMLMVRKSGSELKWRTPAPQVKEGEHWLLFLVRNDEGDYVPLFGEAGMFREEGNTLIRANRAKLSTTLEEAKTAVLEATRYDPQ